MEAAEERDPVPQTPTNEAFVGGPLSSPAAEGSATPAQASRLTPKPKWTELIGGQSSSSQKRPRMHSRQSSVASLSQLSQLLPDADARDADNYGVTELRDGFFDAVFLKSSEKGRQLEKETLESTLPAEFDELSPLEVGDFLPRQWREIKAVVHRVAKTRVGVQLLKSFLAIFVAYILCLIPAVRAWLGTYHYIFVVSAVFNHPARSIGSQLDGVVLTTAGTAAGFGWGALGLLLSTSTLAAQAGYGGILALFLALLIATLSWIRAFFIRFYQAVLCAGITIIYTTVADTDSRSIKWEKLLRYLIPWLLGQALSLLVNVAIFPDTGSYHVSLSLNKALNVMSNTLEITGRRDVRQRRQLVQAVVDLSAMFRDMTLDISVSRIRPKDVIELRNLMQAVIRSLLAIAPATHLMHVDSDSDDTSPAPGTPVQNDTEASSDNKDPTRRILSALEEPTKDIIYLLKESLDRCNAALMDLTRWRRKFGPPKEVSIDIAAMQIRLKQGLTAFDMLESDFLNSQILLSPHLATSEAVEAFVFSRQIRESSAAVQALMSHVERMQAKSNSPRIYPPSYPISKAVHRTNAQIRHDRGGAAAGSYQVTFNEIEQVLDKIKAKEHNPRSRHDESLKPIQSHASNATADTQTKNKTSARYRLWKVLHRLQGFESKYAFKACMVTSLLSVPSYLDQSKAWWDKYQAWWAVVMCWVVMHPRVGGNIQDLFSRSVLAIFGAVWAGAAHAAGDGNPYVMAVFAAIYLLPMTYRFTQSTHPRSGLVGILSFIVISLTLDDSSNTPPALLAVHRGVAFFVGTASPILVNWVLWPFVARHELRFALSSMLFYLSVVYRSVLATYVYYEAGNAPTPEDVQQSELLEGRLREGFVRIRQLLVLTRHEARLRAPFDPVAYSALTEASEQLFDHLIAVRQSALFHNPGHASDSPTADESLLSFKRDAVAAILANLYIFAGALRSHRKVPRYIPSAAAARKRLLIEAEKIEERTEPADSHRKWADIYRYSYNQNLTGCVVQLERLEQYTKLICGEQGFDDHFTKEGHEDEHQ